MKASRSVLTGELGTEPGVNFSPEGGVGFEFVKELFICGWKDEVRDGFRSDPGEVVAVNGGGFAGG